MEDLLAFPVSYNVPEVYTLEQKQEAFAIAEQELDALLRSSEDFFETQEEMDATLRELRQHPDQVYTKPFMKKIAAAILRWNACKQEVEWASESVDTSLTPAQVKAQVKQMLETQRMDMERQFDQRLKAERAEWTAQLQQLRDELAEERTHRKAFQSKVKDFSEDVYLHLGYDSFTRGWLPRGALENFAYQYLGILHTKTSVFIKRRFPTHDGEVSQKQMEEAILNYEFTLFDGTEK
jgi:hypothetical protein